MNLCRPDQIGRDQIGRDTAFAFRIPLPRKCRPTARTQTRKRRPTARTQTGKRFPRKHGSGSVVLETRGSGFDSQSWAPLRRLHSPTSGPAAAAARQYCVHRCHTHFSCAGAVARAGVHPLLVGDGGHPPRRRRQDPPQQLPVSPNELNKYGTRDARLLAVFLYQGYRDTG